MSLTFYGVLRVARAAGREEIRDCYLAAAREAHPDRSTGSHAAMAELTQAWHMLKDAKRRHSYDMMLEMLGTKCINCNGAGQTFKQKGFRGRTALICVPCKGEGFTDIKTRRAK